MVTSIKLRKASSNVEEAMVQPLCDRKVSYPTRKVLIR